MAKRFTLTAPVVRESPLHQQIASVLRIEIALPGHISPQGVTWWSVDMAAYAGNAPGIRTARGCVAGVPDLMLVYQGKAFFIEIKASDGLVSPAQRGVAFSIFVANAQWGTATTAEDALALLDAWGIPRNRKVTLT